MGTLKADRDAFLKSVPNGSGLLLDMGGGNAPFKASLAKKGYTYINSDIDQSKIHVDVIADAHYLPFKSKTFEVVVSFNSLEHFMYPGKVVREAQRITKDNGYFIILVPYMAPFHSNDYWRYTPLGLTTLLDGFQIQELKATTHIFSTIGNMIGTVFRKVRLGLFSRLIRNVASGLDQLLNSIGLSFTSYAHSYLIVARKAVGIRQVSVQPLESGIDILMPTVNNKDSTPCISGKSE